jgi:3'-phosphoadenosine 5'-phosphosulfate sulfotransferase (PAPS reductase)/FAD synthetase
MIFHVISVSGGKDSLATALLALRRVDRSKLRFIFCDTGNEHQAVYEYLAYMEQALDIRIDRLVADFSDQIAAKRRFVARDLRIGRDYDTAPVFEADGKTPVFKRDGRGNVVMRRVRRAGQYVEEPVQKTKKVGGGRRRRWSNKAKRRALGSLYPTGNPFLDLCIWKGRFPSRKAQFCTEELKRNMAVSYQLDLLDVGDQVVSWQGVRRDESENRRNAKKIERLGPGLWAFRPLVEWSAAQVFQLAAECGIQPNPLYRQGMGRVGCMPCINVGKAELLQINARFPAHLYEKSGWETLVSKCSKRGFSTFFNKELHGKKSSDRRIHAANRVEAVIEWSRTGRGGRQRDMLSDLIDGDVCSSAYGLCE